MVSTLEFCKGSAGFHISVCGMESALITVPSRDHRPFSQLVLGRKGEMWGALVYLGIVMQKVVRWLGFSPQNVAELGASCQTWGNCV